MEGICLKIVILLALTVHVHDCVNFSGKDVTPILFGSHNEEIFPVAYGDFNADKLTDVFAVSRDHSDLLIYLAHEENPILRLNIQCTLRSTSLNEKNGPKDRIHIAGVSPGDFNGDGLLDVMIAFKLPEENEYPSVEVVVLYGNLTSLDCNGPKIGTMVQEPLMLDVNGDMIMDLFGEVYDPPGKVTNITKKTKKKLWIFGYGNEDKPIDFLSQIETLGEYTDDPFAFPNSNSFVDVNGDLYPELIIITNSTTEEEHKKSKGAVRYEVKRFGVHLERIGDPKPKFEYLGKTIVDDKDTTQILGQSLFFDLNQDGKLVHIVPYAKKKSGKEAGLMIIPVKEGENAFPLPIDFGDSAGRHWHFFTRQLHNRTMPINTNYTDSIVLRVGDYNLDGYPDLIGTLIRQENSSYISPTKAVLFENVPCEPKPPGVICRHPRTFKLRFDPLASYENVTLATFFDIHEDGLVDVVLVRRTNTDEHRNRDTYSIFAIQNSPDYDANFMKVMVLSSVDCPKCPKSNVPYGNLISGPVIEYKTTTQAGQHQTAVAAQMYRSTYMPLDLPYTIFGIGQSPNFIETLNVSVSPGRNAIHSHEWLQIIPNSQIFVVPTPLDKPYLWSAKLFLTPSKAVVNTFVVLLGFCGLVAILVGGLQYKERRDDRKERLEEANRFHMM